MNRHMRSSEVDNLMNTFFFFQSRFSYCSFFSSKPMHVETNSVSYYIVFVYSCISDFCRHLALWTFHLFFRFSSRALRLSFLRGGLLLISTPMNVVVTFVSVTFHSPDLIRNQGIVCLNGQQLPQ